MLRSSCSFGFLGRWKISHQLQWSRKGVFHALHHSSLFFRSRRFKGCGLVCFKKASHAVNRDRSSRFMWKAKLITKQNHLVDLCSSLLLSAGCSKSWNVDNKQRTANVFCITQVHWYLLWVIPNRSGTSAYWCSLHHCVRAGFGEKVWILLQLTAGSGYVFWCLSLNETSARLYK